MKELLATLALAAAILAGGWIYLRFRRFFLPSHRFYARRHKEHEAGWLVLMDGECIAELDYLHDDQPFHVFRFRARTGDQEKINHALCSTAERASDTRIVFQNRVFPVRVPDGPFLANLHEPADVFIRDYRSPADPN